MGTKLYIRNLAEGIESFDLSDMFSTVGDVESAVICMESVQGVERRVAYVQMASEQDVVNCIERFNGFEKNGKMMIVTEDKPHVPNPNYVKAKRRRAPETKSKTSKARA